MRDPNVPESLEGWWILHRIFGFNRRAWDALAEKRRDKYSSHAADLVEHLKSNGEGDVGLTQIVGHKGDLMLTHYARSFEGLAYAQTLVDKLELREFSCREARMFRFWSLGCTTQPERFTPSSASAGSRPNRPSGSPPSTN